SNLSILQGKGLTTVQRIMLTVSNPPNYQFTNLPIYQFTNLPFYQSTNLPFYQSTNLPNYLPPSPKES
ncbi:MAG: hypothetical protein ABIG63_22195, partial [Chloroflexota bacterium]